MEMLLQNDELQKCPKKFIWHLLREIFTSAVIIMLCLIEICWIKIRGEVFPQQLSKGNYIVSFL